MMTVRDSILPPTTPALMGLDEAAELVRVSRRTILRWIDSGELKSVKTTSHRCGRRLVARGDLEAFLFERRR